jgi:hypothetical protein
LFRFNNYGVRQADDGLVDAEIEPRLNQILVPLLSLIEDPSARRALQELGRRLQHQTIADRGFDAETQVLEIVRDLLAAAPDSRIAVKDVTKWFVDRYAEEYERKVTTKWIGGILRKKLQLRPYKSHGVFVIAVPDPASLDRLYEKYGVTPREPAVGEREVRTMDASAD